MSDRFDPAAHLRTLRGRGGDADYLDVKWRIVWLRQEHPDASIETEKIAGGMEQNFAEFKARVCIPGKGSATGHGSESKADFNDFLEKAETKALGRAIAALGYGTQFVGNELDEGDRIVDAPVAPPLVALSALQEETIANAWALARAGDSYNATKAVVLTLKADATTDEWREISRRWFAIRKEHYPMTIKPAAPAAD